MESDCHITFERWPKEDVKRLHELFQRGGELASVVVEQG